MMQRRGQRIDESYNNLLADIFGQTAAFRK